MIAFAPTRAQDTIVAKLPPVVTITRDVRRSALDLPFAISETRPDSARPGQTHLNVDQALFMLPGVTVANRTNPSQDTRISIRGFGARSQFGVRSIRILRDGMPLTLPDGQTPIDYLDLESVGRVEVIRGTASALYGNAGGGVIDLRSSVPPLGPVEGQIRSWVGDYGTRRFTGTFGGSTDAFFYQGNVGHTLADNFRLYSQQELTNGYFRAGATAAGTDFLLQGLGLDMPTAQNPGALTLAQFDADPRLPDSAQVRKLSRKTVKQVQLGLSATRPLSNARGGELFAQIYGGTRGLYNPQTFAVVDVDRMQYGGSARATIPFDLAVRHRFSLGVDGAKQNDLRKNWANCNAVATATATCPTLPAEQGALSLDQREIVSSAGPYVRDEIQLGDRANVSGGVRADYVRFQLQDRYFGDGRDDSGSRLLHAVSPMAGAVVRLSSSSALYANAGSAFETPTTTELGNQPNGNAGLNYDLKPQYSTTYESGFKGSLADHLQYDVALFDTEVRDELIPFQVPNGNGRTYYRNAGRTRRNGIELSGGTDLGPIVLSTAYTYSHFRFLDFVSAGTQMAGHVIPGVPEHQLEGSATWRHSSVFATVEGLAKSAVYVDDANSARASGFAIYNLRLGADGVGSIAWISPTFSVQNLFDKKCVGSVAINAAGTPATARFYEPGAGRTIAVGLTAGLGR
ncbi:MAG TPA: TonB-dependent receptor [Gemmatimonadaceae bacterium]|nr:TonB-dependent receptor [Gemmatimonadaceae bacterium]